MNPIELQEVRKIYSGGGGIHACTLSFRAGGATALLGPSGSGKTTLLQLINGLARPDSGGVRVLGKPIDYDALPRLRLSMGYAVQGTGLFPHLTAFGNVALLARISGWEEERIRSRIAELGRFVGLEEALWQRYPHELSGGQQQRLGLCRAMVLNPPILLLDEPFGALDPITKAEIHREFLKLRRSEPRTVILVTHDVREAMRLADHIILLKEGRVIQEGSKEDFLSRPADAWVAEFFALQLEE